MNKNIELLESDGKFYERIESVLEMHKISKVQFYTDLHISKTTVLNWKKRNLPSSQMLLNISLYLNVSPFYLLFGKECITNSISKNEISMLQQKAQNYDELITLINIQNKR